MVALVPDLRAPIAKGWNAAIGTASLPGVQFTDPPGDPGLFGPDSAIWYIHSDVSTLIGGLSGLLLGGLHHPTLHGTNQHSSYTDDPLARLGRTASFVNAMTWGSVPVVERTCDIVRKMHRRVHGTMPDGRPYDANDDDQLIWTAMTQAHSIVRAHLRYHPSPLSGQRLDEYYSQYAEFAIKLGATKPVPSTVEEVDDYFRDMRPLLSFADETADLVEFFRRPIGRDPVTKSASLLINRAAFESLPRWAKRLYGIHADNWLEAKPRAIDAVATRLTALSFLSLLRWGLGPHAIQEQALERCRAVPAPRLQAS